MEKELEKYNVYKECQKKCYKVESAFEESIEIYGLTYCKKCEGIKNYNHVRAD